ncbi:MAG: hypothetical protein Q8L29_00055 [archaeon]|nr:hypothetical protein [archaeon]
MMKRGGFFICVILSVILISTFASAFWPFSNGNKLSGQAVLSPASTVPLYRFLCPTDHFYTTSSTGEGAGCTPEGVLGYIFSSQQEGTVPLYRLFNAGGTNHAYTIDTAQKDLLQTSAYGYIYEGIAGYVFSSQQSGTMPIYRLWCAAGFDNLYTMSVIERDSVTRSGLCAYERVEGYAYPEGSCLDTDGGINGAEVGTATKYTGNKAAESKTDVCAGSSAVTEQSCTYANNVASIITSTLGCVGGYECKSGKCIKIIVPPPTPPVPVVTCGDGKCEGSETCSSCVGDCGACVTPSVKETVTCEFWNNDAMTLQECLSSNTAFSCDGKTECNVAVEGTNGEKLSWKSTCGDTAYTTIDGTNEKISFDCSIPSCTDSDGGKDYYIKGTTAGLLWATSSTVTKEDYCITEGEKAGRLAEYYCQDNLVVSDSYACPFGSLCEDGACTGYEILGENIYLQNGNLVEIDEENANLQEITYSIMVPESQLDNVDIALNKIIETPSSVDEEILFGIEGNEYCYLSNFVPTEGIITEGDTATVSGYNTYYDVSIVYIDSSEVKFSIDGAVTSSLQNGESYEFASGTKIVVNKIIYADTTGELSSVEFSITYKRNLCSITYSGLLDVNEEGEYTFTDSNDKKTIVVYGVPAGYFADKLVLDEKYSPDHWSGYYGGSIRLDADYASDNRLEAKIDIRSDEEQAIVNFDEILQEASRSGGRYTPYLVNENNIYLFEAERDNDKVVVAFWRSNESIVLVYQETRGTTISDLNVTADDLARTLAGQKYTISGNINFEDFEVLLQDLIKDYLVKYPSSLEEGACTPNWECTITPLVCPEFGKQTKSCEDASECGASEITTQISCSIGSCSGCMNGGTCVPFGYRLIPQSGLPSYCDINGELKTQMTVDANGNWAACQNNYECESNLCSSGECIEIAAAIKEAKGFKALFIRALCRMGNLFDENSYQQCLAENLL